MSVKSTVRRALGKGASAVLFGRRATHSFEVGSANRPHPRKVSGEDAHFFSQGHVAGMAALGVADGVGGSYSFTSSGSKIAANVAATTACIEYSRRRKKTSLV